MGCSFLIIHIQILRLLFTSTTTDFQSSTPEIVVRTEFKKHAVEFVVVVSGVSDADDDVRGVNAPHGSSVNDHIPARYGTLDYALKLIATADRDAVLQEGPQSGLPTHFHKSARLLAIRL